jgi:hypothetical protein
VVRLGDPWLTRCYRLTLALLAAGVLIVSVARTSEYSFGRVVVAVPGGRFAALLPVAVAPDLAAAAGVRIAVPGRGWEPVRVIAVTARLATPDSVRRAGLRLPRQPSILLTGRLALPGFPAPAGTPGRPGRVAAAMALVLRSRRFVGLLSAELSVILGESRTGQ